MTAAGDVAGAWGKFAGAGAQMSNPAFIMELALKANQEAAAFLPLEQNRELQQIARDRRDIKQIELQLKQPEHSLIS